MEVIGRSPITCSVGRSSPSAQAPVRWYASTRVGRVSSHFSKRRGNGRRFSPEGGFQICSPSCWLALMRP